MRKLCNLILSNSSKASSLVHLKDFEHGNQRVSNVVNVHMHPDLANLQAVGRTVKETKITFAANTCWLEVCL